MRILASSSLTTLEGEMNPSSLLCSRRHFLAMAAAGLAAPTQLHASQVAQVSGSAFSTHWQLKAAASEESLTKVQEMVEQLFDRIDSVFSPWRSDSAISLFNSSSFGRRVSEPSLAYVTRSALRLSELSGGSFDPTVGPLVAQWGFGPITGGGAPDWRGMVTTENAITKARSDLTLDLCGIAKGFALDRAALVARREGLHDFLFELGGEFVAAGRHPSGRGWRVSVEPVGVGSPVVVELPSGIAVATSGVNAQSYELGGRFYTHIVDPSSRSPVGADLRSVTVLAQNAMTADGWATALLAAGRERGPRIARANRIPALFALGPATVSGTIRTGGFANFTL
ncbi:FAD:protein FMN transferase [Roseivivax sp. CAU 1761]